MKYKCRNCGSTNVKCPPECVYIKCQDCGNDIARGIGFEKVEEKPMKYPNCTILEARIAKLEEQLLHKRLLEKCIHCEPLQEENERLRAALEEIANPIYQTSVYLLSNIAKVALQPQEQGRSCENCGASKQGDDCIMCINCAGWKPKNDSH